MARRCLAEPRWPLISYRVTSPPTSDVSVGSGGLSSEEVEYA